MKISSKGIYIISVQLEIKDNFVSMLFCTKHVNLTRREFQMATLQIREKTAAREPSLPKLLEFE